MTSSIGIEAYDEEHREVIELGNCGRFSETSANQPLSHRAPTGIGRRHTNALAHAGQTERTVLLEEPETLDVELLRGGGNRGEGRGGEGLTRAQHVHRRVTARWWGGRVRGGVDDRPNVEGHQNPYGIPPGGLRRGVRSYRPRIGSGVTEKHRLRTSHYLLGRAGSHQTDGIG